MEVKGFIREVCENGHQVGIGYAKSCFHLEKLGVVFDWDMERIKKRDKEEIKSSLLLWVHRRSFSRCWNISSFNFNRLNTVQPGNLPIDQSSKGKQQMSSARHINKTWETQSHGWTRREVSIEICIAMKVCTWVSNRETLTLYASNKYIHNTVE